MARTLLGPKPTPAPISEKKGADSKRWGVTVCGLPWCRIPRRRESPPMPPPMMARRRGGGVVLASSVVVVVGVGWPFVSGCGVDIIAVWNVMESWCLVNCSAA